MINPNRCYRPDEIAKIMSVDRSTVYRMIRNINNPLPAFRPTGNGPLRVQGSDLIEYIEQNKTKPEYE